MPFVEDENGNHILDSDGICQYLTRLTTDQIMFIVNRYISMMTVI